MNFCFEGSLRTKSKARSSCWILESIFQGNDGPAVYFTSDPRTSANLTVARSHVSSSGQFGNTMQPSIKVSASNNDYIEISNNLIQNNIQGGIQVKFESVSVNGLIVDNVISMNVIGNEAILVEAEKESSSILIAGNYLRRNDITHSKDLVVIKNISAVIRENTFLDNTVRYVLNWDSPDVINQTTGYCLNNNFFLNKGRLHTMLVKGTRKIIRHNFLVNPASQFEITTLPSSPANVSIDARLNWWGHVSSGRILKRIKDKRTASDLPVVAYEPFLSSPSEIFSTGTKHRLILKIK